MGGQQHLESRSSGKKPGSGPKHEQMQLPFGGGHLQSRPAQPREEKPVPESKERPASRSTFEVTHGKMWDRHAEAAEKSGARVEDPMNVIRYWKGQGMTRPAAEELARDRLRWQRAVTPMFVDYGGPGKKHGNVEETQRELRPEELKEIESEARNIIDRVYGKPRA